MALPKLNTNLIYETTIPSTGRNIKFRPFLVGEEKLFLIAAQSESVRIFYDTTKRVISQCVLDENFDVEELESYDLDFLFLQLRARSVGETEDIIVFCGECEQKNNYAVDFIENVYILNNDAPKELKLDFGNSILVGLKLPKIENIIEAQERTKDNESEFAFEMVDLLIDKVYTSDEVISFKAESKDERNAFIQSMSADQLKLVLEFLQSQPAVAVDMNFKCGHCGASNKRTLKGISDFFG